MEVLTLNTLERKMNKLMVPFLQINILKLV